LKYHRKIDKINELLQSKNKENFIIYRKKVDDQLIMDVKIKDIDRPNLLKALRKYHRRIVNKVKDMHYKVAHEIVNTYDNIYIGKLSTKKILSRNNRAITKRTKRMIGVLSPYLFRMRLIYMGYKYGSKVREVSEYLTTKTCSNCGNINIIGEKKEHICDCGMKADRDENSAKNHLKIGLKMALEAQEIEIANDESKKMGKIVPKAKNLKKKTRQIIEV